MLIRSWNGRTIRQREDGYICLTDMAHACGKQIKHWNENKSAKAYIEALSNDVGIPTALLIETIQGGIPQEQGTWGHRLVALEFSRWLSPEFSIQCNKWVEELLLTGKVTLNNTQQTYTQSHKQALLELLREQLPSTPATWQLRYPPIFWEQLERHWNLKRGDRGCAPVINYLVYSFFPIEVRQRLDEINPVNPSTGFRNQKQHQHFDKELLQILLHHLHLITFVMVSSDTLQTLKSAITRYKQHHIAKNTFNLALTAYRESLNTIDGDYNT